MAAGLHQRGLTNQEPNRLWAQVKEVRHGAGGSLYTGPGSMPPLGLPRSSHHHRVPLTGTQQQGTTSTNSSLGRAFTAKNQATGMIIPPRRTSSASSSSGGSGMCPQGHSPKPPTKPLPPSRDTNKEEEEGGGGGEEAGGGVAPEAGAEVEPGREGGWGAKSGRGVEQASASGSGLSASLSSRPSSRNATTTTRLRTSPSANVGRDHRSSGTDQDACGICLAAYQRGEILAELPCSGRHRFHKACLARYLHRPENQERGEARCPMCRTNLYRAGAAARRR